MKGLSACLLVVVVILAYVYGKPTEDKYAKFDSVDIDEILNSDRLLGNYANCLLDKGRCIPDAKEVKNLITDVLQTECKSCSEAQLKRGKHVVNFLIKNKPALWKELEEKYDPTGDYKRRYADEFLESKEASQ